MSTVACLLDSSNNRIVDGISLGRRIADQGKDHLWDERSGAPVDTVVIHSMSAVNVDPSRPFDEEPILRIFCDFGVSAHFVVFRGGLTLELVPVECKAWHCGGSIMPAPDSRRAVNDFSVGIELIGAPGLAYTEEQYAALELLCAEVEGRICGPVAYVGHEDIAGDAAVRLGLRREAKTDPGPEFDWNRFGRRRLLHKESDEFLHNRA